MTLPGGMDLRCGRWQDVLADVEEVDAVITDPPYGERTHRGNERMETDFGSAERRSLSYAHWGPDDVSWFVRHWAERCRSWFASFTSDDLIGVWREAYEYAGMYSFAPVVVLAPRVRLGGDGPASSAVYLMVARARVRRLQSWGALPGDYRAAVERHGHIGGKPLGLMRAIIGDYTNPGDTVVDPCAGGGTTLLAAAELGCKAIGAEMDPETYQKAYKRLAKGFTPMPHPRAHRANGKPQQGALW